MGGAHSEYGGGHVYTGVLVGKPKGKTPLGKPRHRWEENIKMRPLVSGTWRQAESSWLRIGTGGGHL
jgi:hypothetical protein